jgi:RHS repeat-associated protein
MHAHEHEWNWDGWKFTSYENDSGTGETGLNYAQFRYHASGQGRFMSADLMSGNILSPQSLNRYAYVANDPVNLVDPLGLVWFGNRFCTNTTGDPSDDVCEEEWIWVDLGEESGGGALGGGGTDPVDQVKEALKRLLKNLDPKCLRFLNSKKISAEDYINDLFKFDGLIAVKDEPGTITETGPAPAQPGTTVIGGTTTRNLSMENAHTGAEGDEGAALTVNALGAFFQNSYKGFALTTDRGKIKGGTTAAQEFIMLHELAHGTQVLQHDKGDQSKVDANDKTLEKECKDTIKSFGKGN